jgi:hypothetical protein
VIDESGETVPADTYHIFPDSGVVVFKQRRTGRHYISITDGASLKVGVKITNRNSGRVVQVSGVGVMYTKR